MSAQAKTAEYMSTSLGEYGSMGITGTSEVTAPTNSYFIAIQVIDDITVSAATDYQIANQVDLTAFTNIVAGTVIYGKWSAITLSSGSAIGYLKM